MYNIKKNSKIIIWTVIISIIILVWIHLLNKIAYLEAKKDMLIEESIDLNKEIDKKSDIEMLDFYASEAKMFSEHRLETIEELKEELKLVEWLYEFEILQVRCFQFQITRKINWLEYNINYCKDTSNLDAFRKK